MALIMVADDDPDIANLLATLLSSRGHEVHTASNGPSALALIRELEPDLSILDHYMPEMTGLEVAQRLRTDPATSAFPLLMLSAAAPPTALLFCNVVLAKPISVEPFCTAVSELLRPPPPTDPLRDLGRVQAVSSLLDIYTDDVGAQLDQVAAGVAAEAGAEMAAVGLVLIDAVALCGSYGLGGWIKEAGGMPAEWTPCTRVVRSGSPTLIADIADDPAFADTPLVTVNKVRGYAGVPVHDAASHRVGTLSVMSSDAGTFTADVLDRLAARVPAVTKLLLP
jgi:CheY-like chemotaxis protein